MNGYITNFIFNHATPLISIFMFRPVLILSSENVNMAHKETVSFTTEVYTLLWRI